MSLADHVTQKPCVQFWLENNPANIRLETKPTMTSDIARELWLYSKELDNPKIALGALIGIISIMLRWYLHQPKTHQ